jgi:hypothetical protein
VSKVSLKKEEEIVKGEDPDLKEVKQECYKGPKN